MKFFFSFAAALLLAQQGFALSVSISASKDNTLFEEAAGAESSGIGESFFAGRTGGTDGAFKRRGVLAFDTTVIPATATITGVTLTLFLAQAGFAANGETASIFALTSSWGEGTSRGLVGNPTASSAGDATWLHRFYSTSLWNTPGGDFRAQPSASTAITTATRFYSWSSPGLISDVQSWTGNSASNFGWLISANEALNNTALRFSSREATTAANRPQLTVTYTVVPEPASAALLVIGSILGLSARRPRSRK